MRPLLVLCGGLGVVAGLVATVLLHLLPSPITNVYYGYAGSLDAGHLEVFPELSWWPMLLALPGAGLVVGLLAAAIAHRRGWRLRHEPPATSEPSTDV